MPGVAGPTDGGALGIPDSAAVEGTEEDKRRGVSGDVLILRRRIELLACLPFGKLQGLSLQQRLNQIGRE